MHGIDSVTDNDNYVANQAIGLPPVEDVMARDIDIDLYAIRQLPLVDDTDHIADHVIDILGHFADRVIDIPRYLPRVEVAGRGATKHAIKQTIKQATGSGE